jgi:hypothetical protein
MYRIIPDTPELATAFAWFVDRTAWEPLASREKLSVMDMRERSVFQF